MLKFSRYNKLLRVVVEQGDCTYEMYESNCFLDGLEAADNWRKRGFKVKVYLVTYREIEYD